MNSQMSDSRTDAQLSGPRWLAAHQFLLKVVRRRGSVRRDDPSHELRNVGAPVEPDRPLQVYFQLRDWATASLNDQVSSRGHHQRQEAATRCIRGLCACFCSQEANARSASRGAL